MKLKSKVAALAAVGVMAVGSMVSAANIGVVNLNAAVAAYPGVANVEAQVKQLGAQYEPQLQAEMKAINALQDNQQKEATYKQKVVPILQKFQAEQDKLVGPMLTAVAQKVESVRAAKGLDVVVGDPRTVVSAAKDSKVIDITADVVNALKK